MADSDPSVTPPAAPQGGNPDNQDIADWLREMANLLQFQGDDVWRSTAYRNAARMIDQLPQSVREIARTQGLPGLDALPTVGPGIAAAIDEIVRTGHWSRLERLRGNAGVEAIFRTIPGVGDQLAHRLHDDLGVESLEALEAAAHDGRLAGLSGIGARRAAAIRDTLTHMLDRDRALRRAGRARPGQPGRSGGSLAEPPVEVLLEVDRAYRVAAEAGTLATIAPRRFNPDGQAWLPVWHTRIGEWHFTAMYSNTARAHELGRVRDWVVIYVEDQAHRESQCTVVTPARGLLAGRRVVRGREDECRDWYDHH